MNAPDAYRVARLAPGDGALAQSLCSMMAAVFEEEQIPPSNAYVAELLARVDFWMLAATQGGEVVGGLTAHVLPMTRDESRELFIYDIAVRVEHQRRGVGRQLMSCLQRRASEAGIATLFVPADDEDLHALDFYRALGGAASPVTFFTFEAGAPQAAR